MAKVLDHKTEGVTIGVLDKTFALAHDLQSVTFLDFLGSVHTIFAHKEGPFKTADDIVQAFDNDLLHPFATHEQAIAHAQETGDATFAERLAAHVEQATPTRDQREGEDY